jgi:uncharacterized protein (DUF433 family)
MAFQRITVKPEQMGGVPCVRGLRIDEILRAYPDLEAEDVSEALRYAAEAVREREIPLVSSP